MKEIKNGIVFSNDIKQILNGNNAYNYQYLGIPSKETIKEIRKDFQKQVNYIFNKETTIIEEEEMMEINNLIKREYPHCNIG